MSTTKSSDPNRTKKIVAAVLAGLGTVLAGVSSAISGIISTQVEEDRSALTAASALVGFATIILIVAFIILWIYIRGRVDGKPNRGLLITFWILAAVYFIMILTGAIICGVVGSKPENSANQAALITAAILPVFSLIAFIIAFLLLLNIKGVKSKEVFKRAPKTTKTN